MQVYDVQKGEYPVDWNAYDGFLLPGSFASAYDTDPWILKLQSVLQDVIVAQQRPMLGICFGHQILAHSFASGRVVKVPTGSRGGRHAMPTTAAGACLLQTVSTPSLYYTHGDMVAALPETAVALGGNQQVPIQAAAYYTTQADAAALQQESVDGSSMLPKPYAVTFQAHPEFASTRDLGMYRTLELILDAMQGRGDLTREHRLKAGKDAQEHFEEVQKDSVNVMASVGSLLGWFP
jgi:GMP synthase-like glutamine amidotransferase